VGKDRLVRVCDVLTGGILWQTNDLPGPGQCVGYSPDGHWLVTGSWNTHQFEIRDAHTGRPFLQLGTQEAGITWSAQFSSDGRYLVTGDERELRIYKVESGGIGAGPNGLQVKLVTNSLPGGPSMQFAPNGRSLVFKTTASQNLLLWNFEEGIPARQIGSPVPMGVQMESFTPDGNHLLAVDRSGKIVTLELPGGKEVSSFPITISNVHRDGGICLSPDGSKLAVDFVSRQGVDIWEPKTGKLLYSLPDEIGTVYWLAWSPDSRRLAVARDNGNIGIWNLNTLDQMLTKLGMNP
jgi:WD40 repeat protein